MKSLPSGSGRDSSVRVDNYECFQWLLPFIDHRRTTTIFPERERAENNLNYLSSSMSSPASSASVQYVWDESENEVPVQGNVRETEEITQDKSTSPEISQELKQDVVSSEVEEDRHSRNSSLLKKDVAGKRPWAKASKKRTKNYIDNAILKTANSLYQGRFSWPTRCSCYAWAYRSQDMFKSLWRHAHESINYMNTSIQATNL